MLRPAATDLLEFAPDLRSSDFTRANSQVAGVMQTIPVLVTSSFGWLNLTDPQRLVVERCFGECSVETVRVLPHPGQHVATLYRVFI